MGRQTTVQLKDKDRHLMASEHQTDAPLLPMAQIEQLQRIAPHRVDWFFDETSKEGNFRRKETGRVNTFVFIERMGGILSGLAIGALALFFAYQLAMAGHDGVAAVIGGTTVVGLVSTFIFGARKKPPVGK